ncbi:MAG: HlyD family efflux transporter periplasmic adaptor subunit [Gemmatimonadaceae bacterium]
MVTGEPTSRVVALGDEAAIVLGDESASRTDIGVAPIRAIGKEGTRSDAGAAGLATVRLSGELVTDPARNSTIRAAVPGRLTSTAWPALGARVSARQVLGTVSDAAPLTAPRSGTIVRVGAQPGELVQAGQELLAIADFATPLARIVWRPELGNVPPRTLTVSPLAGETSTARARFVGGAAEIDSLTRMPIYLYRLDHAWAGARPGTPVTASAPDTRTTGGSADSSQRARAEVVVPDAAIIQWEGLAWAFVERRPRSYVRVRVMTDHPVMGGFVVTTVSSGLEPGNLVVTRGAQQLLSEEFRTHLQAGDDDDAKKQ